MLWFWSGPPETNCWFSFASAFQLILAIETSSLFHVCTRLILCSRRCSTDELEPLHRTKLISCVYHGRTKGEGCGHVKSIQGPPPAPPVRFLLTPFQGDASAVDLLFLSLYIFACTCMSWCFLGFFWVFFFFLFFFFFFVFFFSLSLFWIAVRPIIWERNCPFGFLLVVF